RVSFADEVLVSTREQFADRTGEHAPGADVLVEPEAKDTGPTLAYATHRCRERFGECVVLAVPSDHVIGGPDAGKSAEGGGEGGGFPTTARRAARTAVETGGLVTIGVEPDRPATGYGYIEPGERFGGASGEATGGYRAVERFREKPDAGTAARFLEAGFLWNAGIFAWTPTAFFEAARESPLASLVETLQEGDPERGFRKVESVSVDFAVVEPAAERGEVFVVPADFAWDDLGAWDALRRVLPADEDGNVTAGEALALDSAGNVLASDDKHVSVVGVEDLVVAAFDDRVLVVPAEQAQRVREVVERLREEDDF
ncbi:MAG: sugar phosphate nucleotidyltransferase, partial [Halobacteriales archaeon]